MYIGCNKIGRACAALFLILLFSGACIFSPKKDDPDPNPGGKWEEPTTPEKVLNNLKLAFNEQNIEFYRKCLHNNYYYVAKSETDDPDIRWSKSEDVRIVENVMNGSNKFIFTAYKNSQIEEYGKDYPNRPDGATYVDEHPDEMWLVINYTVYMEIFTKSYGEMAVDQFMEFKFVQDPQTKLYSIIEWNDLTNQ